MVRVLAQKSLAIRIGFDILIITILVIAVFQQVQITDEVHARQNASYHNCLDANESRHVIVNLLLAVEVAVHRSKTIDSHQKAASIKFYDNQIKRVKFSDCSVYK